MNWEAIGAIGEVAGAITVVATLFYLSLQIRQNSSSLDRANEYAQATSIHNSNVQFAQLFTPIMQDPELASIYSRGIGGKSLDEIEAIRYTLFVKTYLVWAEDIFYQQEAQLGFAAIGDTDLLISTIGPYIARLLSADSALEWWRNEASCHLTPPFREIIDKLVLDGGAREASQPGADDR